MILRSQLDATNPYLPNQTFDVKTRGVVAVRQDRLNWEVRQLDFRLVSQRANLPISIHLQEHGGYLINKLIGKDQSFEKEFFVSLSSIFFDFSFTQMYRE